MRVKSTAFDKAYFDRYYFNPATRVADPDYFRRLGAFIAAYLRLLDCPVRRILDLGCGPGLLHRGLRAAFGPVELDACDASEYLCNRYGWRHASIEELEVTSSYDLVICHDVLQYLDRPRALQALRKLAQLCHGALFFSVLTRDDWQHNCDQCLTDANVYLRSSRWYRRQLASAFSNAGGGLYLKRDSGIVLYALECC